MRDYEELVSVLRDLSEDTGDECAEAADAIEELCDGVKLYKEAYINEHDERIEEIKRHKWISVEERLPDVKEEVIVCDKTPNGTRCVTTAIRLGGYAFWNDCGRMYEVTHWMPLPEPPKEDGNA